MDAAVAHQFLSALMAPYADALKLEIRCLSPDGVNWMSIPYPLHANALKAAAKTAVWQAKRTDVYMGVLPRRGNCRGKEGITGAAWLWMEIDGKAEGQEGAQRLLAHSLSSSMCAPAIIVGSGGGVHAYWRLREVEPLPSMVEIARFESVLRRLAVAVGGVYWRKEFGRYTGQLGICNAAAPYADPTCCEVARILRIPGTFNHKPDRQRMVELIHLDTDPVTWSFTRWRAWLDPQPESPVKGPTHYPPRLPGEVSPLPESVLADFNTIWPDGQKYRAIRRVLAVARKCGFDEGALEILGDTFCMRHQCDNRPVRKLVRSTMRRIQQG